MHFRLESPPSAGRAAIISSEQAAACSTVGNVTQPIGVLVSKYEGEIVIRNLNLASCVKRFGQFGV